MMAASEPCLFCDEPITSDYSTITERGLPNLLSISADLNDGLDTRILKRILPIPIHKACKDYYTKPSTIRKRKRQADASNERPNKLPTRRSQTSCFNIMQDCLYCGEFIDYGKINRQPLCKRKPVHEAATTELLSSVGKKAIERADSWGEAVHIRIQNVGDLVSAEARYHHDCQRRFHEGRQPEKKAKGRPAGSTDSRKHDAFVRLCDHLDENDEHQYSLSDLEALMKSYSDDGQIYTAKHLKDKLHEHYKDAMIVTAEAGKETIYTFLDKGNNILRDNYKATGLSPEDVIDMAGTLIDDELRSMIYDTSQYPKFSEMGNSNNMVSKLLSRLLSCLIKNKRRRIALLHSITAAARPRSFISPILLAISVYVNSKLESRELVDLLSSLGFADDYREVMRLYNAILPIGEKQYDWIDALVNFVFDNADIDIRTLTGHGTWHAMGGIACVTPAGDYVEPELPRQTQVRSATTIGQFAEIPIKRYRKPALSGLKNILIDPLDPPNPSHPSLKLAKALDTVWLASFYVSDPENCPSWSGFNQMASAQGEYDISRIDILPFINQDPTQPDTIYSTLLYVQDMTDKYKLGISPVTFDQPLFSKASEIVASSPHLDKVIVRLGGFHLLMSYMGAIGHIMSGSGLQDLWQTVYAANSTKHMVTGKAYARALRAHMLSAASVVAELLDTPGCLSGMHTNRLKSMHEMLLKRECIPETVLDEGIVKQFTQILDDLQKDASLSSRTGKQWVEYLQAVCVLLRFLRAERTGNWELHLLCISEIIPILHSGGHTAYAKAARLYLDQMRGLSNVMDSKLYEKYTKVGYWTIRRTHKFWSGNFTDQTIEQVLMRMLKSRGGLNHGRGITSSTQAKMVNVLPHTVPICESLQAFCGIYSQTNDQHTDLRATTTARDGRHFKTFRNYLSQHSPFSYTGQYHDRLVCISTGVVAPKSANADNARELGKSAAECITGTNYADVKLKRKDRVISISEAENSVTVRGKAVEVDPTLLFMRVTCVIKHRSEMEDHLKYEFSRYPPAIFHQGTMRKNTKSVLANVLKGSVVPISSDTLENPYYVVDGGHLLHSVSWPNMDSCTYSDVCDTYVSCVTNKYGTETTVCFDGYSNVAHSTKSAEQRRRAESNRSADIVFDQATPVSCDQRSFLSNQTNKSRLITMLRDKLTAAEIENCQSQADADYMISSTTMNLALNMLPRQLVLVGTDTDLLIMLVNGVTTNNVYMQYAHDSVYSIHDIQQGLPDQTHKNILLAHAITGCDTVSALFNVGKKKALSVLQSGDWTVLKTFLKCDASHEELARVGELFILRLYNAKQTSTLDRLRYLLYMQKMRKASASFQLESLPPTSAAAKFHSYRTYFTIQQWLGNVADLDPTDWGWELQDGMLTPIQSDRPVAPLRVLRIVSCGCKAGCGKSCKCRKSGLHCTPMCSSCIGLNCMNACPIDEEDHDN